MINKMKLILLVIAGLFFVFEQPWAGACQPGTQAS